MQPQSSSQDKAVLMVAGCRDAVGPQLGSAQPAVDTSYLYSCGCDGPVSSCVNTVDVPVSLHNPVGFWDKGLRMTPGVIWYLLMKNMYRIGG